MASTRPRALIAIAYEEAAEAYLRSLPKEHFMESISQGTQRKIFLESMDLVHADRPDVQAFNELLVQYPLGRQRKLGQVVPDNMVVVSDQPIKATGSFNWPLQPKKPLWMLEYVSRSNKRKDYDDSFDKYELQLKVPYYLIFYPDEQELTLYHHNGTKYVAVRPNKQGRYAIPEIDIEVALLDGWVRFWYKGELLPLPADLQRELDEVKRQLAEAKDQAAEAKRQAEESRRQAEHADRRAADEARRAEDADRRAADEAHRADELQRRIEQMQQEMVKLQASAARRTNGSKPDK